MQTRDAGEGWHNLNNILPIPECLDDAISTQKRNMIAFINISQNMRANLKRDNYVCIIMSKYTYRPMRPRVVGLVFYHTTYTI